MPLLSIEGSKNIFIHSIFYTDIFTEMFTPSMLLTTLIVLVIIAVGIISIIIFIKRKKNGEKQNQAKLRRKAMVGKFANYSETFETLINLKLK